MAGYKYFSATKYPLTQFDFPPNSIVSSLANKQTRPDFLINAEKGKRKGLKRIQTIIRWQEATDFTQK